MTLSSEDLFGRQRQTWASCPDWVQTMILKNIRETIKAKMQQEHRVREDRREGFTDDWAAVAAEVQSQISSRAPTRATPRIQSQTPGNLGIGALAAPPGNQFDSQETVTSFDFSQTARLAPTRSTPRIQSQTPSNLGIGALAAPPGNQFDSQETVSSFDFSQTATRLLSFLDSDPQTPDGSQEVAMGLTLDNTVTPTTLRQLALSIEDLESQEEAAVHSEPSDMEQGQGRSNDACS
jgi:hypothetical protein